MFTAIHKLTKNRVDIISNGLMLNNPLYPTPKNDEWLADPNMIENYDDIIKIHKEIIVKIRVGSTYLSKDLKEIVRQPHFFVPNATELGIIVREESKEHKLCKRFIKDMIHNNNIKLKLSTSNNVININELDINYYKIKDEQIFDNESKVVIGDIYVPFNKLHELLGYGICFEIQLSKQRIEKTKDRTEDRILNGCSVVWLFKNDFNNFDEDEISLINNEVPIIEFIPEIKKLSIDIPKRFRTNIYELICQEKEHLNKYKEEIIEKIKVYVESLRKCPKCGDYLVQKDGKFGKFKGCNNYPECKYSYKG